MGLEYVGNVYLIAEPNLQASVWHQHYQYIYWCSHSDRGKVQAVCCDSFCEGLYIARAKGLYLKGEELYGDRMVPENFVHITRPIY